MDKQLFDVLKKPQPLDWLEAAIIRDCITAGSEFEECFGVSVEAATCILFAWESAQSSEWDRALLADFFDPEIFPNRRIVHLRIEAAMPEKFAAQAGLQWLESECIPVGDLPNWVRQNLITNRTESQANPPSTVQNGTVAAPVVTDGLPEKQVSALKKSALIAELEYEWSSIELDISEASRNGLKAAHNGKYGEWDKGKARAWAVSKGKIKPTAPIHSLSNVWQGSSTRHTISP